MSELSEKEVIEKIKDGDINYFAFFVNKYSKIVYYYVLVRVNRSWEDAEDIVQNAFIKMYKALGRFEPNKPFYPYFFTIIKNEIKEFYRKNKKNLPLFDDIPEKEKEESLGLDNLIKGLKPDYQKVLKLYFEEGFTYGEIASKMGKPINSIKTLIRRGKEKVKDLLAQAS